MKKMILTTLVFITAFIIFLSENAFAGAWTVPKHNIWMEIYWKYVFANDHYNNHWKREPLGMDHANNVDKGAEWWAYDTEFKAEYGLADWLNFLYAVSYELSWYKEHSRPASWGQYTEETYGIKYQMVGGKMRFLEDPFVLSGQLRFFIPGSADKIKNTTQGRGIKETGHTLDRGDYKLELRALIGKTFELGTLPCFAGAETGYRWRSDESANDIPVFLQAGFSPLKWLIVEGELDSYFSHELTGKDREDYVIARGGLVFAPGGAFSQYKKAPTFNVEVQGGYVVWGKNTNASWEVVVKMSTQFDIPHMVEALTLSRHKSTKEVSHPTR